jgi:glycosyltransferase involved in cell wall biosynthesis
VLVRHPKTVYLVDGKPHPGGWGVQSYYSGLKKQASALGLIQSGAVFFNTEFSDYGALLTKLEASVIYVNPYIDSTQSVSGTVAMALAAGAAVVSTPYPYALEVLKGGVGVLVPFRDSRALAKAICGLLSDPARVAQKNIRAAAYAAGVTWKHVAKAHLDIAGALRS